ncbi:MAG: NTP transferase domain-containing protein [Oscillospiraceae bacterium]|nr:NTP transferase domain-containing protein [Oscillospiraceae bacterium]
MKEIIILAAGEGKKMFPFDLCANKAARKVMGTPLLLYNIRALRALTDAPIRIITLDKYKGTLSEIVRNVPGVGVETVERTRGTADTLLAAMETSAAQEFIALYADTLLAPADVKRLWEAPSPSALVFSLDVPQGERICCNLSGSRIAAIGAHHRGDAMTHCFGGFALPAAFARELRCTPEYFPNMKCGEGAPCERYLEAALSQYMANGGAVAAVEGAEKLFDIDKPWQLLEANMAVLAAECGKLTANELAEGASIDPSARIGGFVRLGKRARIGRNVTVEGNLIVGDDTVIDNGAMFLGDAYAGARCRITDWCQLYDRTVVGDDCIVGHCCEFLGGVLMDKVYLYHHGELYGMLGNCVDIGAGCVCGTLRFDDREPMHSVRGRRESAGIFGSCSYIGDYSRTGVGVILQPGCKIGAYSAVGGGSVVAGDVPHNTCILLKQEFEYKPWGPEKYGW